MWQHYGLRGWVPVKGYKRFDDRTLCLPLDLNTFVVQKSRSQKQINKKDLKIVNGGVSIIWEVSQMPSNFVI